MTNSNIDPLVIQNRWPVLTGLTVRWKYKSSQSKVELKQRKIKKNKVEYILQLINNRFK